MGLTIALILNEAHKGELQTIYLIVCNGGKREGADGVAGSFTRELCQRGHDVLVIAYPHRVSVDLAGKIFNPEDMTIFDEGPVKQARERQFDFGSGTLEVEYL